jgi:hypothetical protein
VETHLEPYRWSIGDRRLSLKKFYNGALKNLTEHSSITASPLLPVSPQYSTGEALLGALYRGIVTGVSERDVKPIEIEKIPANLSQGDQDKTEFWNAVFLNPDGLATPQTNSVVRQLTPLVPSIANYSCIMGKDGKHRWNPRLLLFSIFSSGAKPDRLEGFLLKLQSALNVDISGTSNSNEDLFAQFIERNLASLPNEHVKPVDIQQIIKTTNPAWSVNRSGSKIKTPAERTVADLTAIISLRESMTRRHWISLVESILRIGSVTHFLWTCMITYRTWELCVKALDGEVLDYTSELESAWREHAGEQSYLLELMSTDGRLKYWIDRWFRARIGLAIILHALDDLGIGSENKIGHNPEGDTIDGIVSFIGKLRENRLAINQKIKAATDNDNVLSSAGVIWEQFARQIACMASGAPKNAREFSRYVLRQLETQNESQTNYDQGYLLKKVGKKKSERQGVHGLGQFSVRPGPLALIALVSSTIMTTPSGSANLDHLKRHLKDYGIHALPDELETGSISSDLRKLGLVVDSPDAKGGLSLVNPLPTMESNNE